jgi:hypothetical protein
MKVFRSLMILALAASPLGAHAGGYTSAAIPTQVEVMGNGVLIRGAFGDVQSCGVTNTVWIPKTNPAYKEIVSMAYTALVAGRALQFYVDVCGQVPAHWAGNVINQSTDNLAYLN